MRLLNKFLRHFDRSKFLKNPLKPSLPHSRHPTLACSPPEKGKMEQRLISSWLKFPTRSLFQLLRQEWEFLDLSLKLWDNTFPLHLGLWDNFRENFWEWYFLLVSEQTLSINGCFILFFSAVSELFFSWAMWMESIFLEPRMRIYFYQSCVSRREHEIENWSGEKKRSKLSWKCLRTRTLVGL